MWPEDSSHQASVKDKVFPHHEIFTFPACVFIYIQHDFNGLMQKRCNSIANPQELCPFRIKPYFFYHTTLFCPKFTILFKPETEIWFTILLIFSSFLLITLDCSSYVMTGLRQHGGCRCPGACFCLAPGHQQPPCWLCYDNSSSWITSHRTDITLQPLTKHCSTEARRSVTHWFLCNRQVRFLTSITPYDMSISPHLCPTSLGKRRLDGRWHMRSIYSLD